MLHHRGMDPKRQELRRQQLDAQFEPLRPILTVGRPNGGWIRCFREARGMSLEGLAQRLKLASRSLAFQLEKAELDETITLRRFRAAADSLGCDLAIVFVPREPLSRLTGEADPVEPDMIEGIAPVERKSTLKITPKNTVANDCD